MPRTTYGETKGSRMLNTLRDGLSFSSVYNGHLSTTKSSLVRGDHRSPTPYYHGKSWEQVRSALVTSRLGQFYKAHWLDDHYSWRQVWQADDFKPIKAYGYPDGLPVNLRELVDDKFIGHNMVDKSNVYNQALADLRKSKFEMGTALGELGTTVPYLAHRGVALLSALSDIKKGRVVKAVSRITDPWKDPRSIIKRSRRRHPRTLAGIERAWLESRYAIRPLVYDVSDLSNLYRNGLDASPIISGSSKSVTSGEINRSYSYSPGFPSRVNENGNWKINYRCKLVGRVNSAKWSAMKQLGLDNLGSVGWELLPFSFMVDWILPIGDFIAGWTGSAGLDFVGGYESYKCTGKYNQVYSYDFQIGEYTGTKGKMTGGGAKFGWETYTRNVSTNFPLPRLPSFHNNMNMAKLADLASITNQIIRGMRT